MNRKMTLIYVVLASLLLSTGSQKVWGSIDQWKYVRHKDQMTDQISCVAISPDTLFDMKSLTGPSLVLNSWVRLIVTTSGILQIRSDSPLDPRRKDQIGVRVNNDPPDFGVSFNDTATVAYFSPEQSADITRRMFNGGYIKVQAAFFPFAESKTRDIPLTDFGTAMSQRIGCIALSNSQSWFGVYFQAVNIPGAIFPGGTEKDPPGVALAVWTVDPDKAAATAGFKVFDAILIVNGERVSENNLGELVNKISPGESVEIVVLRNGKTKSLTVQRPRQ